VYQEVQELLKRRGNGGGELDDEHDNHEVTFVEDENNTKMGWGKKLFSVAFIIGIITLLYASVLVLYQEGTSCGAAVKTFASSAKKVSGDIFSFSPTASNVFDNWPLCLEDSSSDVDLLAMDDICKTNNCLVTIPSLSSISNRKTYITTHELSSNEGGIISKVFGIMKSLFDGSIGSIMSNFTTGDGSVSSPPSSIINHTQPTPPMCFPPDNFVEVVMLPVLIQNQDKAEMVIESLKSKVQEMKESETSWNGRVKGLKQSEAVLKDQLNEAEKKLTDTKGEIEQLKGSFFDAREEAEQQRQRLVNQRKSEETIQVLQDNATTYKAEVSKCQESITSLGNDKKDIEAEKNSLEDIVVQYQTTITSLERTNMDRLDSIRKLQDNVATLEAEQRQVTISSLGITLLYLTLFILVPSYLVIGLYYNLWKLLDGGKVVSISGALVNTKAALAAGSSSSKTTTEDNTSEEEENKENVPKGGNKSPGKAFEDEVLSPLGLSIRHTQT